MSPLEPLLAVRLSVGYPNGPEVLRDIQLDLFPGEVLGLVGHSGSGKSTLALAIFQLLWMKGGVSRGSIRFLGRELTSAGERRMRRIRGKEISLVLQSPVSSLNPALRIRTHFREAWKAHAKALSSHEEQDRFLDLLATVNLPADPRFLNCYPAQVSVGQAQRVLIAMAILHRPKLLIADEPTSALDPITQSEILDLFCKLNRTLEMAILYISHDLHSVASFCHRVAILHEGTVVECGETSRIFCAPEHPYSQRLVAALPRTPVGVRA